jgi:hypothetical protein
MRCPYCGAGNLDDARFCDGCRAALMASPGPGPAQNKMSTATKWVIGIIGSVVVLAAFRAINETSPRGNEQTQPRTAPISPSSSSLKALTASERLAEGRRMAENYSASRDLLKAKEYLSQIPASAAEYADAKRLINQLETKIRKAEALELPRLRESLAESYRQTVATANSHLNFISSKTTRVKGGYAIWAVHEFFSQFTLSMGGDAKTAQAWISTNYSDLKKTQIRQVGFWGSGAYGSRCWLTIE